MPAATKFVTQEQHQALAAEVRILTEEVKSNTRAVERLSVRVEVISHDSTHLLREVADLREALTSTRDELREELTSTREEILRVIDEKHAVLLSAIMQLGKKAP